MSSSLSLMRPSRPSCATCHLPLATCVCGLVPRVRNPIDVLVLQHPLEAREAKGTVRLLALSLERCRVVIGEVFDPGQLAAWLDAPRRRNVLLYPADGTSQAASEGGNKAVHAASLQLVVLDGTWRKSLKMLKLNPLLQALPRLALQPTSDGLYRHLRQARRPHQMSTLEATCTALASLDHDATRYVPLLASMAAFVRNRAVRAARAPE